MKINRGKERSREEHRFREERRYRRECVALFMCDAARHFIRMIIIVMPRFVAPRMLFNDPNGSHNGHAGDSPIFLYILLNCFKFNSKQITAEV